MRSVSLLIFLAFFNLSCKDKIPQKLLEDLEASYGVSNESPTKFYSIKKFVDGDTFWINNDTEKGEKIRLIGIDAPESRNMFNIKKEVFGKEASNYVEQFLRGKKVRLEYDVDKYDRYGRTLAYVFLEDGTFLNAHLLEVGIAQLYTVPPNVKYVDLFIELQMKARTQEKGLWQFQSKMELKKTHQH